MTQYDKIVFCNIKRLIFLKILSIFLLWFKERVRNHSVLNTQCCIFKFFEVNGGPYCSPSVSFSLLLL